MGKRSRRRSESRSDSEDTIRKAAKKARRERRKSDHEDSRERDKSRKKSKKDKRRASDEGSAEEDREKRKKDKKKEKKAKKKEEKEKLLEERRQRLKLWKAKKGIPTEEKKPEGEEDEKTKDGAAVAAAPAEQKKIDLAAQLAAIKAKLATKNKNESAGSLTEASAKNNPESEKIVVKEEDKGGEPMDVVVNGSDDAEVTVKEENADLPKGNVSEEGVVNTKEPVMQAPKLKQPKKWVAAVYELIGTEEFDGAPFLGTFVENKELKGRVYDELGGKKYLYYWRPKRQWIIGENYSSELGLVFVDTLARTPDQIARPWSFYDGETGEWVETEDLVLRRLPSEEEIKAWAGSREAQRFEMKGPKEKFDGAPFMGVYVEMIGFKPPVYKHEENEFFLYYWKLKKQWIVGRDWKTDQGPCMFVESEAPTPDRVQTYWNFWDPDLNEWSYDEDIWCPKVGAKTADENVEQEMDAEAAAAAVTKSAQEAERKAEEAKKKEQEKGTEGHSDSNASTSPSNEMEIDGTGEKKEGKKKKGTSVDDVDSSSGAKEEGEGADEKVSSNEENDSSAAKGEKEEEIDPLEQFMSAIGTAKSEEEMAAAVGLKKRKRKREHKQAAIDAKNAKEKEDRFYTDEAMFDDKELAKKMKDQLSWLEKNKPKLKDLKPVDHSKMDYEPFRKKFYIESPEVAMMTPEEVKEMCKKELDNVRVRGRNCPKPVKKWTHCGLPKKIYRTLERLEYKKPFPIQATAIPAIMSGRDVIGIAKTGSGKTLAFLLPMFRHILDQRPLEKDEGPMAVILAPTRELAIQIHLEARKFAKPLGLRPVCVYGGASVAEQIAELKRGAEVITGTPGRMIDLLCANSGRVTNLTRVTYLVLDEADRMFDLGFEPQIMRVVQNVRPDRQTVMFSATFPRIVEKLAKVCMKSPIEIMIGGRSVATDNVTQFVEVREPDTRFKRLLEILGKWYSRGSILVFCNKKDEVDFLFQQLIDAGYPCFSVHGDMDQTDRDYAIMDFRNGLRTLMVATSIIARGLDVKNLVLVVNFDAPTHYEDYVHRIGRTGRAGKKGTAITFLSKEEEQLALDLVVGLQKAKQVIPQDLQDLADEFKAKVSRGEAQYYSNKGYDGRGHKFDEEEARAQANERRWERIGYGVEEKTDEDYILEEQKRKEDEERKREAEAAKKKDIDPIKAQIAAAMKAAKAAKKVIKAKASNESSSTNFSLLAAKAEVKKVMDASNVANLPTSAAQRAAIVAANIRKQLKVAPMGNNNPDYHTDEIEINDYPQYARYKMTQRSVVADIEERYECTITTKGTFVPPGRKPKDGERKLWLQIEGKTQVGVIRCKADIRRTLEEAASMRPDSNARRSGGGKYQVLSLTY